MNVILVILDSLRKDHVGAYGNGWIKTPALDALAKESLRFTRAYPESLPTIPARRAIHTGLRTFPFKDWAPPKGQEAIPIYGWQPIPEEQTTLAEILQEEGYETLLVTDNLHQFKPSYNFHRGFGAFEFIRGQGRDPHKPYWLCPQEKVDGSIIGGRDQEWIEKSLRQHFANTAGRETEEDWFAPQVFLRAAEFLQWASQEQPFFLVVDCFDPHEPWDPPEGYVDLYDDGYDGPEPLVTLYGSSDWLTERQLERMRALYAGEVTMVDRWLGNFLDEMDDLGLVDDTLLVVLSDHGISLGEHGFTGKVPQAIYPELIDVPFFVRHPEGKGADQTSDHYASTHDVVPTVLGALGIEPPESVDGQDLSVLLDGEDPEPRPHFTAGYNNYVWARDEGYVLISGNDGSDARLFDLESDPEQNEDVAGDRPDVVRRMFEGYVLKDAGGGPLPNYDSIRF